MTTESQSPIAPAKKSRWKRWRTWLIISPIIFVIFSFASIEVTSTSSFCNSCHIMEPYYTSWKSSTHKDVQCVECHIPPGTTSYIAAKLNGLGQVVDDVLHRTSNKPSASVSALSCLRSGCHSTETLVSKKLDTGVFKFDHSKHLNQRHLGVEITCGTCHSHVKGEDHFQVNTDVCITCHLVDGVTYGQTRFAGMESKVIHLAVRNTANTPKPDPEHPSEKIPPSSCKACHEPPQGEITFQGMKFDHAQFLSFGATCESCHQGVTATPPPIEDGRCLECHSFGLEKLKGSREMHTIHTLGEHKVECSSCHGSIRHGLAVQTSSLETFVCTRCHSDQHKVQRNTYFNLGASPHNATASVPAIQAKPGSEANPVSPMFLAHVDCTGCHVKPRPLDSRPDSGATVLIADASACDKCHQPGFGEKMIPLWQKGTKTLYDQIESDLKASQAKATSDPALAQASDILTKVRTDGSWGVHNPRYTQQLLDQANTLVQSARKNKDGAK